MASFQYKKGEPPKPEQKEEPPKSVLPPGEAEFGVSLHKVAPNAFVVAVERKGEKKVISPSPGPLNVAAMEFRRAVGRLFGGV